MFFAEVVGFWLLVGIGFYGWRRMANGNEKGFGSSKVLPPSEDGRATL